jgi:hypothetical protein
MGQPRRRDRVRCAASGGFYETGDLASDSSDLNRRKSDVETGAYHEGMKGAKKYKGKNDGIWCWTARAFVFQKSLRQQIRIVSPPSMTKVSPVM